ncbi:MAG TPA: iron export ABC transporter permease subunit FetB [Acidimicrobiia bacterium]|nr:iron export ABC transporter permease subunit FetB [Acidimicrobiia bacterium]
MEGDVNAVDVAVSVLLVAVAIGLSVWRRLGLEGSLVWSSARALVQLLLVGAALAVVIDPDRPLVLAWAWVVLMVVFAAETVRRRAPEVPGARSLALASYASAAVVSIGVLFGLGVFPLEGRTLVPLVGMMVGNSMNATVLVARRILEDFADRRGEVEARLALGQPSSEAARPVMRRALRTALIPQIETTKAVGIVFLPGAMTGLILAGVDPVDAVLVQIVVMYLVLGSTATTTVTVALGLRRRLFTPDHRLVPIARAADA